MNEEKVKNILGFLVLKYKMDYVFYEFKNYLGTNATMVTYSYYNKFGCFTIANIPVRGDVQYYRFNRVEQIKDMVLLRSTDLGVLTKNNEMAYREYFDNISKYELNIFDFEPEIWYKHRHGGFLKIPFFWGTDKQILQALADVIETQIKKNGSFFGIKVL